MVQPTFEVIHRIALRDSVRPLPAGGEWLVSRGLVHWSEGGFRLTSDGHRLHRTLLDQERASLDLVRLDMVHESIASLARRFARLHATWVALPSRQRDLLGPFHGFVPQAERTLLRVTAVVRRFEPYPARLRGADLQLQAGDLRFAIDQEVESIGVVWDELHEDYLQTIGRGYEVEDV